jgi:hypothetical protein
MEMNAELSCSESDLQKVVSLLINPSLCDLTVIYAENLAKKNADIGLNLFQIISPVFQRENFHSDILRLLLDPKGPHNEGPKYLKLFIEYLQALPHGINIKGLA